MKYIRKINESNDGVFSETFMKSIDKLIFSRLGKVTLDQYYGSRLWKRDNNDTPFPRMIEISDRGYGSSTSSMNEYEKENPIIKYRYVTEFNKQFNIVDKDPVDKQIRTYEKKLELLDILSDIEEKINKVTHYCYLRITDSGKNYIGVSIKMGFSEDMFMGAAMRKVNNVVR